MKVFFATDIHGSEICWKKFLAAHKFYEADALILGGDMTGKAIVPIIAQGGGKHKVTLLDQETILEGQEQVDGMNPADVFEIVSLCRLIHRSYPLLQ